MSFKFKYNLGDKIKINYAGKHYTGTIVGTDLDSTQNIGVYLAMPDYIEIVKSETYDEVIKNLYRNGTFKSISNLSKDKRFIWIGESHIECVLDTVLQEEKPKNNKKESSQSFKRWLSGIDQYSEDNYPRGNSGFKWL